MRHAMMEPTGGQAQSDRGSKSASLGISRTAVVLTSQKPQRGGDDYILRF